MTLYVNNSSWRKDLKTYAKDGGTWKEIKRAWVRDNGVWEQFYGAVELKGIITPHTPTTFRSSTIRGYVSNCVMDSTHALVAYTDNTDIVTGPAFRVMVQCLTISDTTVSYNAPISLTGAYSTDSSSPVVLTVDSTHAIVIWSHYTPGDSYQLRACCITRSGDTITENTHTIVTGRAAIYMSACMLTSDTGVAFYHDQWGGAGNYQKACTFSMSGTAVTINTQYTVEASYPWVNLLTQNSITRMDDTHAIITYHSGSSYGGARCITISGTTISAGSEATFDSANVIYHCVCSLDSTHALVSFSKTAATVNGVMVCLSLSDTTITVGTPVTFETPSAGFGAYYSWLCKMDDTHAILTYYDADLVARYGKISYVTLTDTTPSFTTPVAYVDDVYQFVYARAAKISSTKVITTFVNAASSNYYGMAVIDTIA